MPLRTRPQTFELARTLDVDELTTAGAVCNHPGKPERIAVWIELTATIGCALKGARGQHAPLT